MNSTRSFAYLLAQASLLFNVAILSSVALDAQWVRTRAAGGQFDEFPIALRIIYLMMTFATFYLIRFLYLLYRSNASSTKGQRKAARWLGVLFILSTLTQLISRSSDERWNAIPAAIIAFAFLKASRTGATSVRS